ncbi:response regulator transcription factor [Roseibium algae]|uniref:Response regulator transcription factor n=1 Tax=Roseibium algae TaxID=3123038 RepID=A0ABU8THA9_9HYPH
MNSIDTHQLAQNTATASPVAFIVDDEPEICALILEAMKPFNISGKAFTTGRSLLDALRLDTPDVCLIDLGLPDIDGMSLINEIRQTSSVPILVLSARNHSSDRVMGLEMGADDYVVKPFDPREVVARIRSILRRSAEPTAIKQLIDRASFEGWSYLPSSHSLTSPDGEETYLSTGEATLLDALLRAPKRVLTRDYLLEHGGRDESMDRSIDVRISRIRKKLSTQDKPSLIRTIYGSGYMLAAAVEWS